jgi:hypothetical protein
VERWFPYAVRAALPDPIKTLADLIEERAFIKKGNRVLCQGTMILLPISA